MLIDALFPRRCPVCGDIVMPKGRLICPPCVPRLSFVKGPVCQRCGKEIMSDTQEYCADCARRKRSFEYGAALLNYNETASRSMAAVKYKNKREYLAYYAQESVRRCGPLLRSMKAIDVQARRVLALFGDDSSERVTTTLGAEQEYFLIDKDVFNQREDLILTGRTLFGAKPPRGQELEDHYFGAIKPRVAAYMKDLDETLWALGIPSKTKHNEVAPSQHEMAPVYTEANAACDQNQLVMEVMKKVADRHGLVCLLHEKPFAVVKGSGQHDN